MLPKGRVGEGNFLRRYRRFTLRKKNTIELPGSWWPHQQHTVDRPGCKVYSFIVGQQLLLIVTFLLPCDCRWLYAWLVEDVRCCYVGHKPSRGQGSLVSSQRGTNPRCVPVAASESRFSRIGGYQDEDMCWSVLNPQHPYFFFFLQRCCTAFLKFDLKKRTIFETLWINVLVFPSCPVQQTNYEESYTLLSSMESGFSTCVEHTSSSHNLFFFSSLLFWSANPSLCGRPSPCHHGDCAYNQTINKHVCVCPPGLIGDKCQTGKILHS